MNLILHSDNDELPLTGLAEVHVVTVNLLQQDLADFQGILSKDEQTRAARFALPGPRRQFTIMRGQLRRFLGRILDRDPRELKFTQDSGGKPRLVDADIHFNVSHSSDHGLIAIAPCRVGVDIERLRPMENANGLVQRFFSSREGEQYQTLPEELKLTGFFRAWTAKEALLKAVGVGLQDLESCIVDLDPRRPPAISRFDHPASPGLRWTWQPLVVPPGYVAALAVEKNTAG